MTWNQVWPIGNVSVRANRATGNQNTSYITTTMGNDLVNTNAAGTKDHFWNVSGNLDGHHRFMKMPKFTSNTPEPDPNIGAGIDFVIYAKQKLAIDSTFQQDVQPFAKNASQIMQVLGIRAMGVFNGSGSSPAQADVVYSHNLALQSAGTPGIVRTDTGRYTVTFATALPSANYLVLGTGIRNDSSTSSDLIMYIRSTTSLTNSKSTTEVRIAFKTPDGSHHDPLQAWFVCFGG